MNWKDALRLPCKLALRLVLLCVLMLMGFRWLAEYVLTATEDE